MYQKRETIEKGLLTLVDLLCVVLSLILAFYFRYHLFLGIARNGDQLWMLFIVLVICILVDMLTNYSHHFSRRGYFLELQAVVKTQAVFSIVLILLLYIMHRANILSRLVWGSFIVVNAFLMYAGHLLLKWGLVRVYKRSRYSNRLLLVTTRRRAENIIKNINQYNEWDRLLTGLALLDADMEGKQIASVPVVAGKDGLLEYVVHHDIDEVFIADGGQRHTEQIIQWIREFSDMGISVDVNIDLFDYDVHAKKVLNRVGKYAVVTFSRNIISSKQAVAKRILDVAGSVIGMIFLGIVTVFVAPAIKLDSPGPVFFSQIRIGKNGRPFRFYKFRSMYQDAEQRKADYIAQNEVRGLMFKMSDDPRITRVGRFLRKTSIDEIPQFWNVLKGDMSLVGTRPPTLDEFRQYEAKHKCRLSMTPGLTGMWQISGRSDITDFDEVVKLDMQYIDDWTIWKDIRILLMTIGVVLTGKGSK